MIDKHQPRGQQRPPEVAERLRGVDACWRQGNKRKPVPGHRGNSAAPTTAGPPNRGSTYDAKSRVAGDQPGAQHGANCGPTRAPCVARGAKTGQGAAIQHRGLQFPCWKLVLPLAPWQPSQQQMSRHRTQDLPRIPETKDSSKPHNAGWGRGLFISKGSVAGTLGQKNPQVIKQADTPTHPPNLTGSQLQAGPEGICTQP